jgi:hypothetical protein
MPLPQIFFEACFTLRPRFAFDSQTHLRGVIAQERDWYGGGCDRLSSRARVALSNPLDPTSKHNIYGSRATHPSTT